MSTSRGTLRFHGPHPLPLAYVRFRAHRSIRTLRRAALRPMGSSTHLVSGSARWPLPRPRRPHGSLGDEPPLARLNELNNLVGSLNNPCLPGGDAPLPAAGGPGPVL